MIEKTPTFNSNEPLYSSFALIEQAWLRQGTCIVNLSSSELTASRMNPTAHEMIAWFRDEGLPLAIIADMVRVERKSVYAWIKGGSIRPQNQERLETLYNLLLVAKQAELIHLYRFWNRKLINGKSLATLLKEESLNVCAIKEALSELWPMAIKIKKMNGNDCRISSKKSNPFLEEIGEVIIPDEP